MTNEVGRQRGGRESRAHSSARREATLGRSKRKVAGTSTLRPEVEEGGTSTSRVEVEEAETQHPEHVAEEDVEAQGDVEADEQEEEQSEEQNRRTTTARNPPKVAEPQVTKFDGGPSDLSLLPSFRNHVAAVLWRGECSERTLKCMNSGKRINSLDKPETDKTWFWDRVEASGLRLLLKTNYNHVCYGLLTAFTERWQPETGTFHLPIGEMTITLDDVSCLLHIPITGKMLNHAGTSCTMEEGQDMCEELLNFSREDAQEEFDKMKGVHVSFAKLLEIYHNNLNLALEAENNQDEEAETVEFLRDCTVKAFLLYLIGGTLFTNKSDQYVDLIFLSYLQDIPLINTWNWGASGLAYIYNYLDRASRRRCGNHGGYNCMDFCAFLDENYTNEDPVGAKYYPLKTGKWPYETRTSLDRMEVDEVTFCPYEDHRQTRPFQDISWYSGWIMCGSSMICPHLPERVLRQYGHVQSIPRAPGVSAKAGMNQFSIQDAFDDYLNENYVTEEMRDLATSWREIMIEEENANKKCDVFEICKTVREEVREKLDSELTLEAARQVLEKVYNDLEHVVKYFLHRKRKRDSGDGKKKKKKKSKTRGEEAGPSGQGLG
ncbi:hypothetical protein TSUD_372010 [Trifolium subterraneum]|uniref:Aminotransferase-like plant mobile domain-containing protein n=1 Tax=Trifolium subterraneum TaxID=3900 RepID=A0A2Z6MWW8_TRISU|nr:hypothetical protein TSUD_372010 [Trifolium subterraneum]